MGSLIQMQIVDDGGLFDELAIKSKCTPAKVKLPLNMLSIELFLFH